MAEREDDARHPADITTGALAPEDLELALARAAYAIPADAPCSVCGIHGQGNLVAWVLRRNWLYLSPGPGPAHDSLLCNGDHPAVLCQEHAAMALRAIEELFEPIARAAGRMR